MDKNSSDLIKIVSAYVNDIDVCVDGMDLQELYTLSKVHNLCALVFHKIKSQIKNEATYKKFECVFMSQAVQSTKQTYDTQNLIKKMTEQRIEHILIKGIVLKKMYTPPELRAMGDVDFVIKPQHRQAVHEILLNMGYEAKCIEEPVFSYYKGSLCFEVHTQIKDCSERKQQCIDFLSKIWDNAECKNGYTYLLNENFDFLYMLIHLLKHFDYQGCGLKFFLDIALFTRQNSLDQSYIDKQILDLDIKGFADLIYTLCNSFFGVEILKGYACRDKAAIAYFAEYCMNGGAFGFHADIGKVIYFRKKHTQKKNIRYLGMLLQEKLYMVFLPKKHLIISYPILKEKAYLLPIIWIHRIVKKARTKFSKSVCVLLGMNPEKVETDLQIEMFNKIGL